MRRLTVFALAAAAAFSFAPSATASHECITEAYGVHLGDFEAGICFGGYCTDLCFIELEPYCHGEPPLAKLCFRI